MCKTGVRHARDAPDMCETCARHACVRHLHVSVLGEAARHVNDRRRDGSEFDAEDISDLAVV